MSWRKLYTRKKIATIYKNGFIVHFVAATMSALCGLGLSIHNPKSSWKYDDSYIQGIYYGSCIMTVGLFWPIAYPTIIVKLLNKKLNK